MKISLFCAFLSQVGKTLYSKSRTYFSLHEPQLLFIFVMGLLINFLSKLPYFNIFLSPLVSLIFIWIMAVILLRLSADVSFLVSLVLLFITPVISIFRNDSMAEQVGNIVYFLLLIGFIQTFPAYLKTLKSRND